MAIFSKGHSSKTGPVKKKKTVFQISYSYTSVPIYGPKFQNLGGQKNLTKILKNGTFGLKGPPDAPRVSHPPPKMVPPYSLGTCPPKTPKTLWHPVAPSSRKHWLSEDPWFWPKYSNGPRVAKNWPKGALRDVSSCLETKFDKKIPMGSVPNCRKEIANCYGIRWFKCKLKPPKKLNLMLLLMTRMTRPTIMMLK